ncbi:MAG TPA: diacylglycerol kinase family protein [Solirubrobacteraceae bacterium]|nr:diacylglycerol kinase family protein [Solirubrobacteraceae bacterium]
MRPDAVAARRRDGAPRRAVCVIVNPSAGRGRAARLLPRVEQALRAHELAFRVERTRSLAHARELARSARERGEIAAAMGGDGVLSAVAGELRGTDGVLGVLPGGRGNDFARKLGIGSDPAAACAVLAHGRERAVDVAEIGGRTFLGIASAGLDSDVQEIANATRVPLGRLVYLFATVRALASWRAARWHVVVDGETHAFRGYSVAVANSGVYGGGMYLAPDAALDDGLLDVVLLGDKPRTRFLVTLPKVFRGTHVHDARLVLLRGREVTFSADRPFVAFADGDPAAALPATATVAHRALRVLAP